VGKEQGNRMRVGTLIVHVLLVGTLNVPALFTFPVAVVEKLLIQCQHKIVSLASRRTLRQLYS